MNDATTKYLLAETSGSFRHCTMLAESVESVVAKNGASPESYIVAFLAEIENPKNPAGRTRSIKTPAEIPVQEKLGLFCARLFKCPRTPILTAFMCRNSGDFSVSVLPPNSVGMK